MCSTQIADTHAPGDVPVVSPSCPLINDRESLEVTCPVSEDTKNIGKSVVEPVLPHDGQHSYPLRYHLGTS